MKKLLFIIAVLLSFSVHAQTFTPIHNYQAPDGLDVAKFFGIPHGATPTLNGVNRPGGHPLFYNTTDSSLYLYSGNQWIRVGGGNGNKDTVLVDEGLGVRFDSLGVQHIFAIHPDGYEGGIVTYAGTGFDFNVSPITLFLNNKVFLFPEKTITLSPPNSLPRYDIFGVDSLGAFVKSGDTSALPIEPQIGVDSFALTKAFLISPGDTAPSNITTVIIYDENTEWTTGTQGSASVVDFDNTDNPYHLTKDIFISRYNNNSQIYFVNGSYTSIENTYQSVLLLPIYLNSALAASNNIYIRLYDTLTASTNLYRLGSNDNFNKNEVNAYQTVVIPTSNLTWINNKSTFTSLLVTFSGYDTSGANGLYMDYVRLQKGLSQTGNGSCPLCIVDIHVTADSMYQVSIRQNGDTASVINWTGGGSGATDTTSLSDRINLKLNISDTAAMLSPYLRKNAIAEGTNVSFTGTGTDADPIVINASSGGTGGISELGDSDFGLTKPNDSTYNVDSAALSLIYPRIKDSTIVFVTPSQLHDSILSNKVTVITKSPLATYLKHGSDLYDSIGIRQAGTSDSGYLSKEDWNRFNSVADTSYRIVTANNWNNSGYAFSTKKGIYLLNNTPSSSTLLNQYSPPIYFRDEQYRSGTSYPGYQRIYGYSASNPATGGGINIEVSPDSATWTSVATIDRNTGLTTTKGNFSGSLNLSDQFVMANAGTVGGAKFNPFNGFIFGTSSRNNNSMARVEISDTTRGFLINAMSTNARMMFSTIPFSASVTSAGTGYTNGGIVLTGGSGAGSLQADIVTSGGAITSISNFHFTAKGYKIGDVLTVVQTGGSGGTVTITSLKGDQAPGLKVYDSTLNREYQWNAAQHQWISTTGYSGSYTTSASSQTTFTVTLPETLYYSTYKVVVTPTASLTAAPFYVTNKTTTSFDVVFLAALTGTATFDWILQQQ